MHENENTVKNKKEYYKYHIYGLCSVCHLTLGKKWKRHIRNYHNNKAHLIKPNRKVLYYCYRDFNKLLKKRIEEERGLD